jgi:hypothetical protein
VPGFLHGVRGNNQAALSWSASTDNVGVDHYNVYRFSATGSGGGTGSASTLGSATNGSGRGVVVDGQDGRVVGGRVRGRHPHRRAFPGVAGRVRVAPCRRWSCTPTRPARPGARLAVSDQITITSTTPDTIRDYVFSGSDQITIVSGTDLLGGRGLGRPGHAEHRLQPRRAVVQAGRVDGHLRHPAEPVRDGLGDVHRPDRRVVRRGRRHRGRHRRRRHDHHDGQDTDGASSSASTDKTSVSTFTAAASGTLTGGHARAWLSATGTATTKVVVYSDSSGAPGTRLASSNPVTITQTSEALVDYTFSGADQIAITSGTVYWVGLAWVDPGTVSLNISRDATASGRQETSTYAPTTFGTPTALTGPIDVYVDISSASGSVVRGVRAAHHPHGHDQLHEHRADERQEYQYTVSAVDAAGNESAQSATVTVIPGPPDTTAPTVPTGVTATAGDRSGVAVCGRRPPTPTRGCTATASTGAGCSSMGCSRPDQLPGHQRVNGTLYSYQVYAVDRSLNASALSTAATATPTAPAIGWGRCCCPPRCRAGRWRWRSRGAPTCPRLGGLDVDRHHHRCARRPGHLHQPGP